MSDTYWNLNKYMLNIVIKIFVVMIIFKLIHFYFECII